MISYVSALVLVTVYNSHPDRPWRASISLIHKVSGIALILLPLATVIGHWRDFRTHLQNLGHVWRWSWRDVRWLLLMGPSALSRKIELPHQGKFNAAEKINFVVLTSTYPLYVLTGLLIWLPGVAILAWFLHFGMAIVATPLLLGHVFMATINPDTRVGLSGMVSGYVDRHWAKHHYRLWYDEHFEDPENVRSGPEMPAAAAAGPDQPAASAQSRAWKAAYDRRPEAKAG
jgi:formate dehydrogenase subunit gamma